MQRIKMFLLVTVLVILCASCDHTVSTETTVHEDGTLDKKITFIDKMEKQDFLDSISVKGWKRTEEIKIDSTQNEIDSLAISDTSSNKIQNKKTVTLSKTFNSADEANRELASPNDTLFRITSKFEKKFRWFYTYIYYSDTYRSLNRMVLPPNDYLTQEDYGFIERLPKEGAHITKADSLYLKQLTSKIFDVYGERAIFEDMCSILVILVKQRRVKLGTNWIDSLQHNKEKYFRLLMENKDNNSNNKTIKARSNNKTVVIDSLEMFLLDKIDRIHEMESDSLFKGLSAKTNFISYANDGEYTNKIIMPWDVVNTNADSIAGRQLFWSPPTIKFLLKDYTMFAESRKLNPWPLIVSILFVGFAGYLFFRKRISGND